MSRNLCQVECACCPSPLVVLQELPRPITEGDAGCYIDEFQTMLVADAVCPLCQAKYLAWCVPPIIGVHASRRTLVNYKGLEYYDLSFRSTFNDEPGEPDGPTRRVSVRLEIEDESAGFCGYNWMVTNILRWGTPYCQHEFSLLSPDESTRYGDGQWEECRHCRCVSKRVEAR